MMNRSFLLFIALFTIASAQAADWKRVYIPGAKCGSGIDYSVFVEVKNKKKLAIEFMGGGACWSISTCYGPNIRTWMYPVPMTVKLSTVLTSSTEKEGILKNYTKVFFPYCTGDIYGGDHDAKYMGIKGAVHHRGYSNVQKALNHLEAEGYIDFAEVKRVVTYGSSAGALGSLLHTRTIDDLTRPGTEKVLIADAPGLHFGKTFWDKFPKKLVSDYVAAMKRVGIDFKREDGHIAFYMKDLCNTLNDWSMGFLQGSQDIVMSSVFGNISPKDHEALVYGENGMYQQTLGLSNCAVWAPKTKMHTFLLLKKSAHMTAGRKKAINFVQDIIRGNVNNNYK